jgi:predicted nucleotidyltransferase
MRKVTAVEVEDITRLRGTLRKELPLLSERYAVASLGLFGSYVRREARAGSDLDILVSFRETPGLLRFIELENYLSDLLGVRVDLVMADALKPRIQRRILAEVVPV